MKPSTMQTIASRTARRWMWTGRMWMAGTAALCAAVAFGQSAEDLRLTVGKSVVIDYPSDIRQISTSNPDIIDASPVTTKEILMHGKGLGNATLIVWSRAGDRTFYNVTVDLNLDPLRKILKDTFPNEAITPDSTRDSVALSGRVSNKDVADRAVALAAAFGKTVVNNLQVAGPPVEKQILLRVRFAELDRQKEQQYGVNWLAAPGGNLIGAGTGQFGNPTFSGNVILPSNANSSVGTSSSVSNTSGSTTAAMTISQALNIFAFDPALNIGAFIKALQSNSILQILAEPNLVTTNGKEAYFLVGGEFPVPILQGGANSGAVTVQFREFGIRLRFTPVLTEHNTVKMHLAQEVSTLDPSHGVTLNGFSIPALSTRRAETDVELGEGQSFVVAGLLNQQETESFSKLPILSSIPILGNLFKTRDENKQRTDLVLLVTPEVTQPLGPNDPKPQIYFPNDFLVRLDPGDTSSGKKLAKSGGKKN
jgi:pilus assembly protein CpaC